jgi:inner membrane protein
MDSVSQIALGAAVGVAVMGRRTAVWKAAAWGAVAGTLPDLDVLIDYGNPVHDMVLHRAETHAPFWLTLFSLPFAAAVARLHGEWGQWRRWWLALWLVLVTHPLLDTMTVYGTQIGLPFTNRPFGVGSVFIIDPLYTLPLLIGTGLAWALWRRPWAPAANVAGLVLSCAYLVWGVAAQAHVQRVAQASLAAHGLQAERMLVTPTAFNSVAWRIVVMQREHYLEGFYSLRDAERHVHFDRFDRGTALEPELRGIDGFERIAAFSRGFYALRQDGPRVLITDLRMGQEPTYTFSFAIAERASPARALPVPVAAGRRPDVDRLLPWLGRRIGGDPAPPPR